MMSDRDTITFHTNEISEFHMYKLMIGSVVPRPIAWVSTISKGGVLNLAPFSFFTIASRQPPTLMISIGPGVEERKGTEKDTLTNIRETKEFVINMVSRPLGEAMIRSAANVDAGINEFELAGVTPRPGTRVQVPAVRQAPIAFELSLNQIIPLGSDHVVLGTVECVHIDPAAYAGDFKLAIESWEPLASLAGDFATISRPFTFER
ncbi:flavin reductase family protein [Brevibacillus sp. AG]|uniref:flavin reductase family protein n=1 Tax=Brevibacillus sp. AG TaxID=3020891 RepID=UPI000A63614E|nr:flavin reductase family protein [Brevibacillus sp. AG]MDC0759447.1 flavin reductase family protein [Brevibacillus sp. AG]